MIALDWADTVTPSCVSQQNCSSQDMIPHDQLATDLQFKTYVSASPINATSDEPTRKAAVQLFMSYQIASD